MDLLRFRVLRAFGVAPWSEEAKGLTDEMCLEYAAYLDIGEESSSASFNEAEYLSARESAAYGIAGAQNEKAAAPKPRVREMSDYIEREMRRRDTGFITY